MNTMTGYATPAELPAPTVEECDKQLRRLVITRRAATIGESGWKVDECDDLIDLWLDRRIAATAVIALRQELAQPDRAKGDRGL